MKGSLGQTCLALNLLWDLLRLVPIPPRHEPEASVSDTLFLSIAARNERQAYCKRDFAGNFILAFNQRPLV